MVGIGLTELQNAGGRAEAQPAPSAPLQYKCVICIELIKGDLTCEKNPIESVITNPTKVHPE